MNAPYPPVDRVVVGAAVVSRGRVLAARRSHPAALAGGWELPGGKLEPGETLQAACVREVREELACEVRALAVLPGIEPLSDGYVLRVVAAELVAGEPVPTEHDALRWLGPDEVEEVAWLPADLPFLPAVCARLRRPAQASFHEREDAQAALAALGDPAARLVRDRFAGEDDDEDVAWLVEAPATAGAQLARVAEAHAGWIVPEDSELEVRAAAAVLPSGPKRVKRAHRPPGP